MLRFLDFVGAGCGEDIMTHGVLVFFAFGFTTNIMTACHLDISYILNPGRTVIFLCR